MKKVIAIFSLVSMLSFSGKLIVSPSFNINYDKSKLEIEVKTKEGKDEVPNKENGIENQKKRDKLANRMSFGFDIEAKYDVSKELELENFDLAFGALIDSQFDYFNLKSNEIETSEHEPPIISKKIYFNGLVSAGYKIREDLKLFISLATGPGVHIYNYPMIEETTGNFHTSINAKPAFSWSSFLKTGISYKKFNVGLKIAGNFTDYAYEYKNSSTQREGNVKVDLDMFKAGAFISYDFDVK